MFPARLTTSLEGAGNAPVLRTREDEMYPTHPLVATYLARLQMEEDIARAAAYRTAREAAAARKAARRRPRPAHSRGPWFPAVREAWAVRFGH